ncbi:hypothetical protein [[Kitasatospora] papulosa]|uniref:hypothetical protein n=2 Tax=Streptomyces TaxID=1883 RepID=UPI00362A2B2C|nr:hypothetical protein [Streptomyces pratensis]
MLTHDSFVERIETIQGASNDSYLVDRVLTDVEHNSRARLLRNGLMVVAFTSLEDFIRARTKDVLDFVSRTVVPFPRLPQGLREAATMGAMKAARDRAQMAKSGGEDHLALLQEAAAQIASTAGGSLQISRFSLGYSGSNVSSGEIASILTALNVQDAWNEITTIAQRCGAGSLPLKPAYDQAMRLRHEAAHRPDANVQPWNLQEFCTQALAIALGFDVLASRAARLLRDGDEEILRGKVKVSQGFKFRFLDIEARGFVERREGVSRAVKVTKDEEVAVKSAVTNSTKSEEPLVRRDSSSLPVRWFITDGL